MATWRKSTPAADFDPLHTMISIVHPERMVQVGQRTIASFSVDVFPILMVGGNCKCGRTKESTVVYFAYLRKVDPLDWPHPRDFAHLRMQLGSVPKCLVKRLFK